MPSLPSRPPDGNVATPNRAVAEIVRLPPCSHYVPLAAAFGAGDFAVPASCTRGKYPAPP
jgi:hypothetical protein